MYNQLFVQLWTLFLLVDFSSLTSVHRLKTNSKLRLKNHQTLKDDDENNVNNIIRLKRQTSDVDSSKKHSKAVKPSGTEKTRFIRESEKLVKTPSKISAHTFHRNHISGKHRFARDMYYNDSTENIDDEIQTVKAQQIFNENESEERRHIFDAINEDYSYEENQLHEVQSDIMKKLIASKLHDEETAKHKKHDIENSKTSSKHLTMGSKDSPNDKKRRRKRLILSDDDKSLKDELQSDVAKQIIDNYDKKERESIISTLNKDFSYDSSQLSDIQAELRNKMQTSSKITRGHLLSRRDEIDSPEDAQSEFAKEQIAEEEGRQRDRIMKAMTENYALAPDQIKTIEKDLIARLNNGGLTDENEDSSKDEKEEEKPAGDAEKLQSKGFELDDNEKDGSIKDKVNEVQNKKVDDQDEIDDSLKHAFMGIHDSLKNDLQKKSDPNEGYMEKLADADNVAAAEVTAATLAATLSNFRGKDAGGGDDEKADGKESKSDKEEKPSDALDKKDLPEYAYNTKESDAVNDDKDKLKSDLLSTVMDDGSELFANAVAAQNQETRVSRECFPRRWISFKLQNL